MSVEVYPSTQIWFRRPLTRRVEAKLNIRNASAESLAYKIQTTSPMLYYVRPNSGKIEPYSECLVRIMLRPLEKEPPVDVQCQDKFLVKSVVIKKEWESRQLSELWDIVEKDFKNSIYEKKIQCVYLPSLEIDEPSNSSPSQNSDGQGIRKIPINFFKSLIRSGSFGSKN